jgi:hypothetical protein
MKFSGPKLLLHVEGFSALVLACIAYRHFGSSWGRFFLLFLAPDLAMVGYLLGARFGASLYNAVHTYTAPFLLFVIGILAHQSALGPFCAIWVAHIGFDRTLGYGLKYPTAFKDTHLARV